MYCILLIFDSALNIRDLGKPSEILKIGMILILNKIHKNIFFYFKNGTLLAVLSLVIATAVIGCVKENAVPAYIHIPSFTLTTKNTEGSSSQKITDAWVYVDGEVNGVFPIPATLPIAELGDREITIFPGIRNNGTRSNPIIYPFYNSYKIKLNLKAGKIDTVRASTSYIATTSFKLMENFETSNIFQVDRDNNSTLKFTNISDGFEGKSGQIVLTKSNPIMEKSTTLKAQLSESAEDIFLEMNYKIEAPLNVGIVGSDANGSAVSFKILLFPNKEWNKTYINFTNEAKDLKKKDFQIVLQSVLPDSLTTANILIDNVKLIQK